MKKALWLLLGGVILLALVAVVLALIGTTGFVGYCMVMDMVADGKSLAVAIPITVVLLLVFVIAVGFPDILATCMILGKDTLVEIGTWICAAITCIAISGLVVAGLSAIFPGYFVEGARLATVLAVAGIWFSLCAIAAVFGFSRRRFRRR